MLPNRSHASRSSLFLSGKRSCTQQEKRRRFVHQEWAVHGAIVQPVPIPANKFLINVWRRVLFPNPTVIAAWRGSVATCGDPLAVPMSATEQSLGEAARIAEWALPCCGLLQQPNRNRGRELTHCHKYWPDWYQLCRAGRIVTGSNRSTSQ